MKHLFLVVLSVVCLGESSVFSQPSSDPAAADAAARRQLEEWRANEAGVDKARAEHPIVPNDLIDAALSIVEQDLSVATERQDQEGLSLCLQMLDRLWNQAVSFHNAGAVARIEAEDFTCTDPGGAVSRKADDLEAARSDALQVSELRMEEIKVSVYGSTAVLTGKTAFNGTARGLPINGSYRWTDVFVQRNGRWQVVASQATTITPPAGGKAEG